jgi:hypothetical protein
VRRDSRLDRWEKIVSLEGPELVIGFVGAAGTVLPLIILGLTRSRGYHEAFTNVFLMPITYPWFIMKAFDLKTCHHMRRCNSLDRRSAPGGASNPGGSDCRRKHQLPVKPRIASVTLRRYGLTRCRRYVNKVSCAGLII